VILFNTQINSKFKCDVIYIKYKYNAYFRLIKKGKIIVHSPNKQVNRSHKDSKAND